MKVIKVILSFAAIVVLALVLNGCEAEKKKAEERGRIPKKTLDNVKDKIGEVEDKMRDRMKQVE